MSRFTKLSKNYMAFGAPNLIWGISEKKDGQMLLTKNSDNKLSFLNRKIFFSKLNVNLKNVVSAGLVHGSMIKVASKSQAGKIIPNCDGLVTNQKNIFLTITAADCLPIYFYDRIKEVIGIAHAGWRGLLKNISGKMVAQMAKKYQTDPKNIFVHIGPQIKKCHFEVKEDVAEKFKEYEEFISEREDKIFIDLAGIAKSQSINSGIRMKNISIDPDCTYRQDKKYFSYRRDKKLMAMVAYISLWKKRESIFLK